MLGEEIGNVYNRERLKELVKVNIIIIKINKLINFVLFNKKKSVDASLFMNVLLLFFSIEFFINSLETKCDNV